MIGELSFETAFHVYQAALGYHHKLEQEGGYSEWETDREPSFLRQLRDWLYFRHYKELPIPFAWPEDREVVVKLFGDEGRFIAAIATTIGVMPMPRDAPP